QGIVGKHHPAGEDQEAEAEQAGARARQPSGQRKTGGLLQSLAERRSQIVRHGRKPRVTFRMIPARANRGPETQRGGRWAAPIGFTARLTSGQFGTTRLAPGRADALVVVPCSRSTAALGALAAFESGGM